MVPILNANDPLPLLPQRIVVAGTSGSGKTTTAARIAAVLQMRHVEIDSLFHGPAWTERASFLDDVMELIAQPRWVTEWQYPIARPLLADRAELMVWLDLPTLTVMRRVISRTVRRRIRRKRLWNDNLEPPLRAFFTDPEHIVRWTWAHRHETGERVTALVDERPDFPVVRLTGGRDVGLWLGRL